METLEQLRNFRQSLSPPATDNDSIRESLLSEARQLLLDLERPHNVVHRVGFQIIETVACSIAIKMGVFKALNESSPLTTGDLAKRCGSDPLLMGRVLRCLVAYGAVGQRGPDLYIPNTVSRTFAEPRNEAAIEVDLGLHAPGWVTIPYFLQKRGWKNWTSPTDTPHAAGWNRPEGATIFDLLATTPFNDAFNSYMSTFNDGHMDWLDLYPVMERLGAGAKSEPDAVMMVDVGGGLGHQAIKFKQRFSQLPGRYIVQDLRQTFPAERPEGVEYMEHDFTTEQPVKGARFYYLRYVPHDWSQEFNTHLCTQLRKAMTPGYSRLIVNEWILPEVGASMFMTAMDFTMLSANGGMERTEALHREYLEKAGLRVTNIYQPDDNLSEGVIEAEVA